MSAFNFPNNPAAGDTFAPAGGPVWRWNGAVWFQNNPSGDGTIALIGDTAPPTPKHGQLWWESDTGKLFVWYEDADSGQWVEAYSPFTTYGSSQLVTATGGSVPRTLEDHFGDMLSVKDFGAVGDGVTDDTTALQNWLNALQPGRSGYVPAGTYKFTSPLVIANGEFSIIGAGTFQSVFMYAGASTTVDLLTVGSSSADIRNVYLSGFRVDSTTDMTAGNGIHIKRMLLSRLDNIALRGQRSGASNLWDGVFFDCVGVVVYDGVDIVTQNDGLKVCGGVGTTNGPKADLWVVNGKIGDCGRDGIVCGGAFGGFGLDNLDVASNDRYGIRIDQSLAAEGNREILFNPGLWVDSNVTAGIVLDGGMGSQGYFVMTGVWCAGGLTACMHITANETASSRIQISGGNFFLGGTSLGVVAGPGDGLKVETNVPTVMVDGVVIRNNNGWGVNVTSTGTNVRVGINHYISNALGAVTPNTNFMASASNNYGIGIAADAFGLLTLGGTAKGGASVWGLKERRIIGAAVTAAYDAITTALATEAAAFTVTQVNHFRATQGTIGAGSAITAQRGFYADSTLVGGGSNYGFYANLPAGATNWGFYSGGTVASQFGGPLTVCAGGGLVAGGTTGTGLKFANFANFGVFFGSGVPTLTAAKGSLYLRSDGTTTNDRMYVNTNGSTTWTAVNTAA